MKKTTIILILLIGGLSFGQNFDYKDKQYDLKIFESLDEKIDLEKTSLETFVLNTKPFSKWDIRPLKNEKVWSMDTTYTASEVPNFIWGAFSQKYNLSSKEAMNKPNAFLNKGILEKNEFCEFLKINKQKIDKLTNLILKSNVSIYLNQNNLQRVDNLYKENELYWNYLIENDSPFPISPTILINKTDKFSKEQEEILSSLNELKIYSAIKTEKGIFYLIDGFTDNSYGFYYSLNNAMETDNFLFQIMKTKKIDNNYFYYIAN